MRLVMNSFGSGIPPGIEMHFALAALHVDQACPEALAVDPDRPAGNAARNRRERLLE